MHKPASNEVVVSLHDLSAVDLIAGFRARQFSPSEVLEDVFAQQPWAYWQPRMRAAQIPCGEVRSVGDALRSPEAKERKRPAPRKHVPRKKAAAGKSTPRRRP